MKQINSTITQQVEDIEYHWKGFGYGYGDWDSFCRIRIFKKGDQFYIIGTDLGKDTGTSVTNSAEHLATLVCRDYKIDPHKVKWYEHYPERFNFEESFDAVEFSINTPNINGSGFNYPGATLVCSNPKWSPSNIEALELELEIKIRDV